jgi:hypothetical protein
VWEATAGGRRIVLVQGCLWGGPQAAILVEELACLGVRDVIGFGIAGSLVESVPKGTQIVGAGGIVIDTTSRAYTPTASRPIRCCSTSRCAWRRPTALRHRRRNHRRRRALSRDARRRATLARPGCGCRQHGDAAAVRGVRRLGHAALWLGHVSDRLSLTAQHWESWQRPARSPTSRLR